MDTGDRGRVRILLVEDDLDQAHLVRFLLEAAGDYEVRLAQDGVKAVELVETEEWDLVITDLNLPGKAGTAVVEAARRRRPDLPIVATTGYTGPEYSQRAVERGADAVIVKPLDRDDLLRRVRTLLTEGRPARRSGDPAGGDRGGELLEPEPSRAEAAAQQTASAEPGMQVLVVAVGPGEAELGCGGALLRHRARGDQVVLLHLGAAGGGEEDPELREACRRAGQHLGVRTFLAKVRDTGESLAEELKRIARGAVEEMHPDVLYLPSPHHSTPTHRLVFEAAAEAATAVSRVFMYDGGRGTPSFRPEAFVPLAPAFLQRKLEALGFYRSAGRDEPTADLARTTAGYWGRFAGGAPAEALEVLRGELPWADSLLPEREGETR